MTIYSNIELNDIDYFESDVALERAMLKCDLTIDKMFYENTDLDTDKNTKSKFKNVVHKVIESIKNLIDKIVEFVQNSIEKISDKYNDFCIKHKLKSLLKNFDNVVKQAKANGMKTFEFIDYKKLIKTLKDHISECKYVISCCSKYGLHRYYATDAEVFIKKVNTINENTEKTIEKILNHTIKYNISEIKNILTYLNETCSSNGGYMTILKEYNKECKNLNKELSKTERILDNYADKTTFIKNAKTIKDTLHNTSVIAKHSVMVQLSLFDKFKALLRQYAIHASLPGERTLIPEFIDKPLTKVSHKIANNIVDGVVDNLKKNKD